MANLYTRTGDKGTTALVGGSRVSKSDLRVEAYGTVDEAISMIGLAKAKTTDDYVRASLEHIQSRLFGLGGELASDERGLKRLEAAPAVSEGGASFGPIGEADIAYLEGICDTCTKVVGKQSNFVLPGVDEVSATLHVARTIIRRAERSMVALREENPVRDELMRYVNRLSDALYALARYDEESLAIAQLREVVIAKVKEKLGMTTANERPFTLEVLQDMAEKARKKSLEMGVPTVFAAVDEGGNLVLLQRMEGSLLGSIEVAQAKAWTANAFKMTTEDLGRASQPGAELFSIEATNPGKVVLFGGGFPFVVDGKVVGGIGISGGTVEEDMTVARYAMGL